MLRASSKFFTQNLVNVRNVTTQTSINPLVNREQVTRGLDYGLTNTQQPKTNILQSMLVSVRNIASMHAPAAKTTSKNASQVSELQRLISTLQSKKDIMTSQQRHQLNNNSIMNNVLGASSRQHLSTPVSNHTASFIRLPFMARQQDKPAFEFNSNRPLTEVIVDVDKPVFTNYFPFNLVYYHASEYVLPLDPSDPGYKAGRALLSLFAVCFTILWGWSIASSLPVSTPIAILDPSPEATRIAMLREVLENTPPSELKALGAKTDWMTKNFTVNLDSMLHRPWTMLTSSISHQDIGHLMGNFFSLFLFMPKVYAFLGPRYFAGLYAAGAVGCSIGHCLSNYVRGSTQKPFSFLDTLILSERLTDDQMEKVMEPIDTPSLGASGSCMAVAAAAAMLFPRDRVMMRMVFIPLPIAVATFIGSDLLNLVAAPTSGIAHGGHLGGVIAGIAYISFLWYSRFLGPRAPYVKYGARLPFLERFLNKPNAITAVSKMSK